jgi:hypothetical protein
VDESGERPERGKIRTAGLMLATTALCLSREDAAGRRVGVRMRT